MLRLAKGYKKNPRYQVGGFPVGGHFNIPDHNKIHDMRVSVVRQVQGGTAARQCEEIRLIIQLGTLAPWDLKVEFKLNSPLHFQKHLFF